MDRKGTKRSWSFCMGFVLTAAIALTGCSGGGGGGTTTTDTTTDSGGSGASLSVAERISVVDASSSGSSVAGLRIGKFRVPSTVTAAGTDWSNDETQIYVHERSAEAFGIINEILCMMAQTQYDEMVNKGTYRAQIDMNQCEQERDSAESAGESSQNQSSSTTMPDYEDWTVNSYRANDTSDHIVKVWIHEDADEREPAKTIYVKVTITEGVSAANPYGLFRLDFKGIPDGTSTVMFKGYLESVEEGGQVLLRFVDEGAGGTDTWTEQVVLNRSADGSTGTGSISTTNNWEGTSSFDIAFNTDYFLRYNGTEYKCADRNSFNETAWRYGLYDANGARVNRESGFPIKYGDYHGWVGYWGLWLPEEANISDGATVNRQEYSSNSAPVETPYTLMQRGGKLKKHTRNATTLGAITNLPLDWWECGQNGCTGYRVKWTGSQFVKFAVQNQTTNMWDNMTETALVLSSLQFGELNFYSQSLGGQVRVKLTVTGSYPDVTYSYPSESATDRVIYFKEDIVYPGDSVPSTLRCYDNCPKYDSTAGGIDVDNGYNGNYQNSYDPNAVSYHDYTFSATTAGDGMLLKEGSNSLLLPSNSTSQWGYMSGPIFNPSSTNLALLDCNFDGDNDPATMPQTCGWKAWSELSEFYTWETGLNQWNQFTALINGSGTVAQFQAPLQVAFEYQKTNNAYADGKYCIDGATTCSNGTNFYLEYSGFGQLWGIPGTCVDMDSGEPTTCGEGTRWISEFMIPAGAEVTNNGTTYYVKPLEVEQTMALVTDTSVCTNPPSSLSTTSYTLPAISSWSDPNIGTEPTGSSLLSEAPAVIGGVVQPGF